MSPEVLERFLRYVKINTSSDIKGKNVPSTQCQFDLANLLANELKEMGIEDVTVSKSCIVYATLPSNLPPEVTRKIPIIGFNAHLDTSPDEPGENVNPQVIDYKGGDIALPKDPNLVISVEETPELEKYNGSKIVTADGTTLLGADDKAGIAEIMTAISTLQANPEIPHGTIKVFFTPDEEIGRGAKKVRIKKIGANFAYTLDGGEMGELEIECFNAANGIITISGYNVHPGYAFDKMINAIRPLSDIIKLFPKGEAPETTKEREGYYHLADVNGDVNSVKITFILRDFDEEGLNKRIEHIEKGIIQIKEKYPKNEITAEIVKSYKNMIEILEKHPKSIELAEKAIKKTGLKVKKTLIRGGTDGAQYSFRGLPTPNLFGGGFNFHSKKEFIPVIAMEKAVDTILNIIEISLEKEFEK